MALSIFIVTKGNDAAFITMPQRNVAAVVLIVPLALMLAFRPLDFGVDSLTYFNLYQQYCIIGKEGFESSYVVSFSLVQIVSLGTCSTELIIPVWTGLVVIGFILLPVDWPTRIRLLALGLISLIGIELATNAFRQALSAIMLMIGIAWFERSRIAGGLLLMLAVALHSSAALVLVALVLATLRWRWYFLGLIIIAISALNYEALTIFPPIESLVYEITKYSAHEANDFWIRVIAAAQLGSSVTIALLMRPRGAKSSESDGNLRGTTRLSIATKLALSALPYLPMPYFGYRYIYGIYFAVLFLARDSLINNKSSAFEILILVNILLALAWAFGSTVIASMIFLPI